MIYGILALYIIGLIGISLWSSKKSTTVDDFLLGGRGMGPWMSAFAYGTTYFSAVIFVGYAGSVGYANGISALLIGVGNAIIGSLLPWLVLAKKTRQFTGKHGISTMPEFFDKRYDSKILKYISAVIIFIFLVPYCASVYQGLSYIFEIALGISVEYCIVGMAVLTAFYLFFGGCFGAALINVVQGSIMLVGVVIMVAYIMSNPQVGGFVEGVRRLGEISPKLVSFNPKDITNVLSLMMLTSLGSWGLPQMIHKFYTIKSEKVILSGTIISTIFAAVIGVSAYFIGAFARFFVTGPVTNTSILVPTMIVKALPEFAVGLVLVLILSASMSTLSSLVLVSASSIAIDLLDGAKGKDDKKTVLILRFLCIVFVAVSIMVALDENNAIVTLMSYSWGTISGSFIGLYVYGLHCKWVTKMGAYAGIATGLITNLLGFFFIHNAPLTGVLSMILSLIVVPLVSMVTPKYDKAYIDELMD